MIIKHSAGSVGSFFDQDKKEWVTVHESEPQEKKEAEVKQEEQKPEKQES